MKNKIALVLGTNAGQADLISYLKENGWNVHACGYKQEGPGCNLADSFHLVDTLNKAAVKDLAKKINTDIVYSVSSDSAIRTATQVSEELGLPHFLNSEIVDIFHYKDRLRQFMQENQISTVDFLKITKLNQAEAWNIFPCVVKPVDSQGQRGIKLVKNKEDLICSIPLALKKSMTNAAIIEEFLEGTEFSTNIIVQNKQILVNEFTERLVHGPKFFGLPKGHSIPVRNVPKTVIVQASQIIKTLVDKLLITDAVLYVQMIATKKGPKIVEVAPRLDGCHIWRLIKIAKGYDLREYTIKGLLRLKIKPKKSDNNQHFSLLFHQMPTNKKFYKKNFQLPQDVLYNEFRYNEGEPVRPINGKLEVVGYYIKRDQL